jgi:hypothetical protein
VIVVSGGNQAFGQPTPTPSRAAGTGSGSETPHLAMSRRHNCSRPPAMSTGEGARAERSICSRLTGGHRPPSGRADRRLGVRSAGPSPSLSVVPSIDVFDYLAGYQDVPELTVRVRECMSRSSPACSCLDRRAAAAPLSGRGNALSISGPAGWPAASRTAPRRVQGDRVGLSRWAPRHHAA